MCGIVGVVARDGTASATLEAMTRSLHHRGPDDAGLVFHDPTKGGLVDATDSPAPLAMGFRRLSIIDPSPAGHQPMFTPDRRFVITFNGEIYNHRELRAELEREGVSFRSRSDTEVLLHLYAREGPRMLARLNGMFAFAVYDASDGSLFLARDAFGVKPLMLWEAEGIFAWASEAKAFLAHPAFKPTLAREHLDEYLLFRYLAGSATLLRGVRHLLPGTYLVLRHGKAVETTWYTIPEHHAAEPEARAPVLVDEALSLAVRRQLESDVKVGTQLSGGVDSSLISWWAARHHGDLFDSVSIVVDDPARSEERFIDAANDALGLRGHKRVLTADDVAQNLAFASWHHDAPISHPNAIGIMLLSEEARHHVTVLLSGEGADEIFGGYVRHHRAAWLARLAKVPGGGGVARVLFGTKRPIDDELLLLAAPAPEAAVARTCACFDAARALVRRRTLWNAIPEADVVERLLTYEMRTHLVDLLLRQDRMSMAHSIENRVPFLDRDVVALSKTLPTRTKVRAAAIPRGASSARRTKRVLKWIAAEKFGAAFAYRPKSGFGLPLSRVFSSATFQERWPRIREGIALLDVAEPSSVDRLLERAVEGEREACEVLWTLVALEAWWRVFRGRGVP